MIGFSSIYNVYCSVLMYIIACCLYIISYFIKKINNFLRVTIFPKVFFCIYCDNIGFRELFSGIEVEYTVISFSDNNLPLMLSCILLQKIYDLLIMGKWRLTIKEPW